MIKKHDIFIDDSNFLAVSEICVKSKKLKADNPELGLIIVDSIQLMDSTLPNIENENRKIVYILNSLKKLAVELDVPVIALSRLTSNFKVLESGRPTINKASEMIEIADNIIMIYRPEYYFYGNPKYENYAELIIAKQKHGPKGTLNLNFFNKFGSFESSPLENSFEYADINYGDDED